MINSLVECWVVEQSSTNPDSAWQPTHNAAKAYV
jgi:hypothetical protein